MESLKESLTTAPTLVAANYTEGAGEIILAVDASLDGWGAVLMQCTRDNPKRRGIIRYESGLWSEQERRYDVGKRECRGVLKALKKVRGYLYGVFFTMELDANTLVAQLNRAASDVPGSVIAR